VCASRLLKSAGKSVLTSREQTLRSLAALQQQPVLLRTVSITAAWVRMAVV
jgi:hypothetical protein